MNELGGPAQGDLNSLLGALGGMKYLKVIESKNEKMMVIAW
jgi:hypothetical protein